MKYIKQINQIVISKKKILGIKEDIRSIKISILGIGENNQNFLISVNDKFKFVFRIALRSSSKSNTRKEFNSLKRIPKGVGPVPIYIDDSHKTIDEPYSILSYIEGNHVKKWTDKRLKLHATKLAKLHQKRFTRHSRGKTFSLYNRLLNEIKGYTSKEFNNKNIKLLMPLVKEFIKSNDRIFTELKSFSRVHTDLCLTNILINNNDLFYIDWEYSMIEDNAYDISKLYFTDIAVSPWSIKLNKIKERIFINQYLKQIKFKDNTLRKRVHLWHIYILFTDSLYCKWKLNNYSNEKAAFPKKVYQKSLDFMIGSLKKKLIKN